MSEKVAAALLAGGQSSRLGQDKAFLNWNGQPLWQVQYEKLSRFSERYVSANAEQEFPDELTLVVDSEAAGGPLFALSDLLQHASEDGFPWLLVLGVDLPLMKGEYLEGLARRAEGVGRGNVPQLEGEEFYEPLAAVFPVNATLGAIESLIGDGGKASLQRLVRQLIEAGQMDVCAVYGAEKELFRNLNTRDDLDGLRPSAPGSRAKTIRRYGDGKFSKLTDHVVAEEPLELRVEGKSVAVVMRTPGHDEELAAGFLLTEGIVISADDIFEISPCRNVEPKNKGNTLDILLSGRAKENADLESLTRHVFTSSSCGVCGKATIESVFATTEDREKLESDFRIDPDILLELPNRLREVQDTFEKTGGLHASAIFDPKGELLVIREDAGRHNALDKVIGQALLGGMLPLNEHCLLVSGRVSFELMQKAYLAGIPVVAGISAPSSLAVEFAERSGQTLVGFLRNGSFNVYAGSAI